MQQTSKKEILSIGLMLFALFFGAGNLIFAPALGQAAGTNIWPAIAGFILTGVGLPLLGVIVVVQGENLQKTAGRAHPWFGLLFTIVIYLSIGPLFAIPRTGSVGYEMGVAPFLSESIQASHFPLFIYTLIFFTVTLWLCFNPSKLVDRIGKILTPILLLIIFILFIKGIIHPLGTLGSPTEVYLVAPFFKGFMEGYLTLDALAGLVFGIVAVSAVKELGIHDVQQTKTLAIRAGMIAGVALSLVYLALAYLGVTSQSLGFMENGGQLLAVISFELFGTTGMLLLGVAVTVACLTTSVGLVSATSLYFTKLFPSLTYTQFAVLFTLISFGIANLGLTQIITFSLPVLLTIYPLAIVIIMLSLFQKAFGGIHQVYSGSLIATGLVSILDGLVSIVDGLKKLNVPVDKLVYVFAKYLPFDKLVYLFYKYLPFYEQGVGWLAPAIVGGLIGYVWGRVSSNRGELP